MVDFKFEPTAKSCSIKKMSDPSPLPIQLSQRQQAIVQQAENQAKQQRLGFWSQANPVMLWDFRHSRKS